MRIELEASRFDNGIGDFDIGHILFDTQAQRQVEIVKFSGYSEIDAEGVERETIHIYLVGASDDMSSVIEFEDLKHAVYIAGTITPIAPDWFVDEVNDNGKDAVEEKRL